MNFGEFLMVWDRLFGTFYDSAGKLGAEVGLHEQGFPQGYLEQLVVPFGKATLPQINRDDT
ncbi:sterol desaturase family protein [Pseudomonas veronii]|uniref:sterol desaturase family protein n=1 Tax=Pseudomonas veronii TaxID=76761 RepID=UPI0021CCB3FC|nr:hypothetical protein [Pseudomonas veronii]